MPPRSLVRLSRLIVFAPAAVIAFSTPASADTFSENFDDPTYDLSVQLGGGAFWCNSYSSQYGTSGPSLCLFNTQGPTDFTFPSVFQVQGFQFVAGAKNGSTQLTVSYTDGTTAAGTIDGSCCEATVSFVASEGKAIAGFSVPADWDLWLFDSLEWWGSSVPPTTTSTEPEQTTSTAEQTSSTSSTSTSTSTTSSSTVPTTMPPPPSDTQPTVETTSPETTLPETTVPTTLPAAVTTIANTTTVPPTTTTEPSATTTTSPPDAPGSTESVVIQDTVVDTGVVEEPPLDASVEEKLEFESKVDVFSGEYDDYVPVGSKISVAERRTVVAVTAVLIMFAPPPSRMRRK